MLFSLPSNPTPQDVSDAINYLLNNFGSNISINAGTGAVAGPTGNISYLYQYLDIKYAQSYDGSVGFSNVPTGATYFGIRNSNSSIESTNPADYLWEQVTGGFGTTKNVYYSTGGGRTISLQVATTSPGAAWLIDPGTAINLDIVTGLNAYNAAVPTIYQWTTGAAPARPTTMSTYTWATGSFTPPTGWSSSIPSDTTPGDTLWIIMIPLIALANVPTSNLDWTNVTYPIVQFSKNGSTGSTGSNGLSALTAYKVQSQSASTPTFTTPTTGATAPSGWSLTAPSVSVGQVLWVINGQYNSSSSTISGIPAGDTGWTGPLAVSVFQDIESDNWDGGIPPTTGPYTPLGTQGYYIQRATGNMYMNNVLGRGVAEFDGYNAGTGGVSAALLANKSLNQYAGVEAYTNNTFVSSGAIRAFNQQSGAGNAIYGYHQGTGIGVNGYSVSGNGVYGTGQNGVYGLGFSTGVYGIGSTYGIYATNNAGGTAAYINGPMQITSTNLVTNLNAERWGNIQWTGSSGVSSKTQGGWINVNVGGTTYYIPFYN